MKALLKIYRLCFAGIAGGLMAGLLFATPAMAADNVTFAATWGNPISIPSQLPLLVRYGDYDQYDHRCPLDGTCFKEKMPGKWTYQVLSGSNNLCADKQWWSTPTGAFDIDSYPGRWKRCEIVVEYDGRVLVAEQGNEIPFTTEAVVFFGMFDSNGLTGTFKSRIMTDRGLKCTAEKFGVDPATAAGMACFKSTTPLSVDINLPNKL